MRVVGCVCFHPWPWLIAADTRERGMASTANECTCAADCCQCIAFGCCRVCRKLPCVPDDCGCCDCAADNFCRILKNCPCCLLIIPLLFGGTDDDDRKNDLHCYDIYLNKWAQLPSKGKVPLPRSGAKGVSYDNKLYFFGGRSHSFRRLRSKQRLDLLLDLSLLLFKVSSSQSILFPSFLLIYFTI